VALEGRHTDIVVLACTHYPFLTDLLAEARLGRCTGSIPRRPSHGVWRPSWRAERGTAEGRASWSSPPEGHRRSRWPACLPSMALQRGDLPGS
jgi:hypothetical protein